MDWLIPMAYAEATPAPEGGGLMGLLPFVVIFAVFYFLVIRPQRKRQKEHQKLVSNLSKGDEVAMTSGMLGKVNKVEGEYIVLQVSDNVELKFQRQAVHAVLPKGTIKGI